MVHSMNKFFSEMGRILITYLRCSKISNTFLFLFLNKRFVIRASIHKMHVQIANREDPEQPDLGLLCLSRPFLSPTNV